MESDHDMDRDVGPDHAESSSNRSRQAQDLSDVSLELAFLRCLPFARPVGKHRHFRMIALQGKIRDMTGVVLAFEEIWSKLGDLYSLDDLDEMASSSASFPSSPRSLSPLPRHPLEYGFPPEPMYSEDEPEPPPEQGTSKDHESPQKQKRIRQSSSDSLSPAPDLPKVSVEMDKGKRGKKRGRKSDPQESAERARSNGTASTRGRKTNDQSARGRSRSNVSETPSTMASRSVSNLKGKQKEGRLSVASPAYENPPDSWVYPQLYPYPLPLVSMDPSRQPTPVPPESRPRARHSRTSFTPATSTRPTNKRWSGASDAPGLHVADPTRYYEFNRINPPAYLSLPSGSQSADLINSRYFKEEFSLPLFADPEVVAEWNTGVGAGTENEGKGPSGEVFADTQRWNSLVYSRTGKGKGMAAGKAEGQGEEDGVREPMTFEVKQEIIAEEEEHANPATAPIQQEDVALHEETDGTVASEAGFDQQSTTQMEQDMDPAEAEAEMDVDMQLLGDDGDQAGSAAVEETVRMPSVDRQSPNDVIDDAEPAIDQEDAEEARKQASGRTSVAALLCPEPDQPKEDTNGHTNEMFFETPQDPGSSMQIEDEDDLDPEFRVVADPYSAHVEPDQTVSVPRATRRQTMSIDIPTSNIPRFVAGGSVAGPSQARSQEPQEDMRISLRRSSGRSLLNSSPVQSSIPFMLNPMDEDVQAYSAAGHQPAVAGSALSSGRQSSGAPSPRATLAPANRRTSLPQSLAQQSPLTINLESQLITPHGFHIVPRTPSHAANFPMELPSTPSTPLGPSQKSETKLIARSPTPPRMSVGPVELPPDGFSNPFPPIALPTPSPSVSPDEMRDVTETEDAPQTPATSPPAAMPSKAAKKGPKRKSSANVPAANVPSSSQSRSTESPEKQPRMGRTTARSNSGRGRGASRGHSRARDTSSARRSTHSTGSSTPRVTRPPTPPQSGRPRPKQPKKLPSINEGPVMGESSSKRQPAGRSNTTPSVNRMDRSLPSGRQSLSNNDSRLAAQLSYDDDTTDHHSTVGSEDELALKPKGLVKKKKPSPVQVDQVQAQPSGTSGSSKDVKKKSQQPTPQSNGPTGPAKATRSNDVATPKMNRRLTRSKR